MSLEKIFFGIIVALSLGATFLGSYKRDFLMYNEEINSIILKNDFFESVVNTATTAILMTDGYEIEYHNKSAQLLFKKPFRFLETCKLSDLIYAADLPKIMEIIKQETENDNIIIRIANSVSFEENFIYCKISLKKHYYNRKLQYLITLTDVSEYFTDSNEKLQTLSLYENTFDKLSQSIFLFDNQGK
jgi:nitrogen-specific signal transduction histidine kinase